MNPTYPPLRPLTKEEQDLVENNVGLARKAAMVLANKLVSGRARGRNRELHSRQLYDDLLDAGMIALCIAAQRYNPELGTYSTFAYNWIMGTLQKAKPLLFLRVGSKEGIVRGKGRVLLAADFIYPPKGRDGLPDTRGYDVWDDTEETGGKISKDVLRAIRHALKPRELRLFALRVFRGWKLQKIGIREGVSKERIRQLTDRAIEKLKKSEEFLEVFTRSLPRRREHYTFSDFGYNVAKPIA